MFSRRYDVRRCRHNGRHDERTKILSRFLHTRSVNCYVLDLKPFAFALNRKHVSSKSYTVTIRRCVYTFTTNEKSPPYYGIISVAYERTRSASIIIKSSVRIAFVAVSRGAEKKIKILISMPHSRLTLSRTRLYTNWFRSTSFRPGPRRTYVILCVSKTRQCSNIRAL